MTILEAMETMRQVIEAQGDMPREKAVAAYNTIATALDISAQPCIEHVTYRGVRPREIDSNG